MTIMILNSVEWAVKQHFKEITNAQILHYLIVVLLSPNLSYFENIVDPEAIRSGSTLFSAFIANTIKSGMLWVNMTKIGEECST